MESYNYGMQHYSNSYRGDRGNRGHRENYDDRYRDRDRDRHRRGHRDEDRHRHRSSRDSKHKKRKRSHSSRRRSDSRDRKHKKRSKHSRRRSDSVDSVDLYYNKLKAKVDSGIPTRFHPYPDPSFIPKYQTPQEKLEEYKRMNPSVDTTVHNKTDRQLYVGNLPPDITIPEIVKHLNDAMHALNLCEKPEDRPIVDAWISSDGHYAFVEFRTIREAHLGFQLTQIAIHGHALKVGKPRIANSSYAAMAQQMTAQHNKYDDVVKINQQPSAGYMNPSAMAASTMAMNNQFDHVLRNLPGPPGSGSNATSVKSKTITITKLLVSNLPLDYNETQVRELLSVVGRVKELEMILDPNSGKYKGEVYVQFEREEDSRKAETTLMGMNIKDAFLHVKKVQSTTLLQEGGIFAGNSSVSLKDNPPSHCLVLINLIIPEQIKDIVEYTEIEDETFEEMDTYGKVEQCIAPKPSSQAFLGQPGEKGVGKVFVRFTSIEDAEVGKKAMAGRRFEGRIVEAYFYPDEKFFKGEFE